MNKEENIKIDNEVEIIINSLSQNELFARIAVSAFVTSINPNLNDLMDVKTAVSEAVTNAIIHGYENKNGKIFINLKLSGNTLYIEVSDKGKGIEDLAIAREPLYTSKPEEERTGMGFTVMETFMDNVEVNSKLEEGTTIKMFKVFKN